MQNLKESTENKINTVVNSPLLTTQNKISALEELKRIKGIGRVKAIRLKAAFELSKRVARPTKNEMMVNSSSDVAKLFMEELRYEKREIVKVVILNTKNKIIKIEDVSLGGTNYAVVEPKEILSSAVKMGAEKIILIHNHPSGNPLPSVEDYQVTKRIDLCAKMFGINLLDHIIIGDGKFKSVFEKYKSIKNIAHIITHYINHGK